MQKIKEEMSRIEKLSGTVLYVREAMVSEGMVTKTRYILYIDNVFSGNFSSLHNFRHAVHAMRIIAQKTGGTYDNM